MFRVELVFTSQSSESCNSSQITCRRHRLSYIFISRTVIYKEFIYIFPRNLENSTKVPVFYTQKNHNFILPCQHCNFSAILCVLKKANIFSCFAYQMIRAIVCQRKPILPNTIQLLSALFICFTNNSFQLID